MSSARKIDNPSCSPQECPIYRADRISDLGDEGKSGANAHTDAEDARIYLCLLFKNPLTQNSRYQLSHI